MTITDLYAKYCYNVNGTNQPIVVLMHGFTNNAADFPASDMARIAAFGFFVIVPGLRGRDSASGSPDASGREIQDIIDAVEYVRTNFADHVSADKTALVGYSGGGGNALAAACKFPDYFNVIVDHFGMSDYGRNNPNGWYYNNDGSYTSTIGTYVGDTPTNKPNNYYARDAVAAIANYSGGYLYIYHDDQDTAVPVIHSSRIKTVLDAAGLTNYSYNISTVGSNPRFTHGYPEDVAGLRAVEATWAATISSQAVWTVPASGTVTVIGYIKTKRFTVWLNKNGTATTGIDAAATVAYNTATDAYTVTPLISGIDVAITQGAKTGSATNISGATVITVT
jgi:pimeloyl-ACP methyl ester carboxylesterase